MSRHISREQQRQETRNTLVNTLILRDRGISYERALERYNVTPVQFGVTITRNLQGLVDHATGPEKQTLEAIAADPKRQERLFYMGKKCIEQQYARLMEYKQRKQTQGITKETKGETQKTLYSNTYSNRDNINNLAYTALCYHHEELRSNNRETVVNTLKKLDRSFAYFKGIGIEGIMTNFLGKHGLNSPTLVLEAFDRAYMERTGDVSLFNLDQEQHLHPWRGNLKSSSSYWQVDGVVNKEHVETAVWHMMTEDNPILASTNTEEVINTLGEISALVSYFKRLGLSGLMHQTLYGKGGYPVLDMLKIFDTVYQTKTGNQSLFNCNQPIYLDETSYKIAKGQEKSWTPVRYNRVFYPTYDLGGKPMTPAQFTNELRAIVAQGTSPFLGNILFAAAISEETPQFLIDARMAFPNRTWDELVNTTELRYGWFTPSEQPGRVGKVNGVVNGKTLADKMFGHSDIKVKLPFNPILYKPIGDDVSEEVLEELLADDYKPESMRKPLLPRLKIDPMEEAKLTTFKRYKVELDRIQTLTDDEMDLVSREKTYHELKARQAFNSGNWSSFENHARRYKAAVNYMTEVNLGLALNLAKKYHRTSVPFDEVLQEANEALIKAVETDRYWKRPFFNLWPKLKIKQRVVRYQRAYSRKARVSEGTSEIKSEIERVSDDYYKMFGTQPSKEELMDLTDLTEAQFDRVEKATLFEHSLATQEVDTESRLLNSLDETPQYSVSDVVGCKLTAIRLERIIDHCSTMSPDSEYYIDPKQEYLLRHRMGLGVGFSVKALGDLKQEFGKKTKSAVNIPQLRALKRFKKALAREEVTLTELVGAKRKAEIQASTGIQASM